MPTQLPTCARNSVMMKNETQHFLQRRTCTLAKTKMAAIEKGAPESCSAAQASNFVFGIDCEKSLVRDNYADKK